MELVIHDVLRALGLLIGAYLIYYLWHFAREAAESNSPKTVAWKGFLFCAGIALFAGFSLGNPTCLSSEQDLRGSECYEYADDGHDPTSEQRAATFAYWLTILYVPVIFGAYANRNKRTISHEP